MKNFDDRYPILKKINSPSDIDSSVDLKNLCAEIRKKIIEVVSKNGGHLSSNLGVVELTVAIHKVFNDVNDRVIWDVSHQSYAHKMLTGRYSEIDTLRKSGGLSGFTNRSESEYDVFTQGHSSTSISSALGLAYSKKIQNKDGYVVAVIGDGALTGGLAYEGLNNAARLKKNFIIVLNDNKMSISKNVGAVARCLSVARIKPSYMKAKNMMERILDKTSIGVKLKYIIKNLKAYIKKVVLKSNIFEDMGFAYYGPIDGHNIPQLQKALKAAKSLNRPTVVHVITTKGKGYEVAEQNPDIYHSISCFDVGTGKSVNKKIKTFSDVFGETMCKLAKNNPKICAITAAMASGTGLCEFKNKYRSRFFDVGIAEEHAVTFAGGLAAGGMIPVFAVYSTFLQRSYDQIIHDLSLQGLNAVIAVDRAGFTGDDGETHQGIFDVPFLSTIPRVIVFAPSFFQELVGMLSDAVNCKSGVVAIRYPRGGEFSECSESLCTRKKFNLYGSGNSDISIITYGRIFSNAYDVYKKFFEKGINISLLKLNVIIPIDDLAVEAVLNSKNIVFFEESSKSGGVGEKFGYELLQKGFNGKYFVNAVESEFVPHASVDQQLSMFNLDKCGMEKIIKEKTNF